MLTTQQFLQRYRFVDDARERLPRHVSRRWHERRVDDLVGMVWHQSLSVGSADAIARYHVNPNHISQQGLPGMSYTFFVEPGGDCLLCNDLESTTYSQGDRTRPGDENRMYVAACFGGNFDAPGYTGTSCPTVEQLDVGIRLWLACRESFGLGNDELYGHYHVGKPACPGTALSQLIETIRADRSRVLKPYRFDLSTAAGRQQALAQLGYYDGRIDGIWGSESRTALARFQESRGLLVDGIWGPQSEQAIRVA
jgi:hypothetical protein